MQRAHVMERAGGPCGMQRGHVCTRCRGAMKAGTTVAQCVEKKGFGGGIESLEWGTTGKHPGWQRRDDGGGVSGATQGKMR